VGAGPASGRIARLLRQEARRASAELADQRGAFPAFERSALAAAGGPPLRNAQVTSIAPTGTISILAGTTSGVEPLFAVAYVRNVLGARLLELNGLFERTARERGFYSEALVAEIAQAGGVRRLEGVPEDVRRAFVTGAGKPAAGAALTAGRTVLPERVVRLLGHRRQGRRVVLPA
jgi:ribonucleoside-diphosphate reductase alpha chain